MNTLIKAFLLIIIVTLYSGVGNAQNLNNHSTSSFSFLEPVIELNHINQDAGLILGLKGGYVFRDKISVGIGFNHLFSENVQSPLQTSRSADTPFARMNYLKGDLEYKAFQLRVIDFHMLSSLRVGRATYRDPINAFSFSSEIFKVADVGIVGGININNRLQLRVGGSYGFLFSGNDINYSIPTFGFDSGEGSIPINYQGFSTSMSLRMKLNEY